MYMCMYIYIYLYIHIYIYIYITGDAKCPNFSSHHPTLGNIMMISNLQERLEIDMQRLQKKLDIYQALNRWWIVWIVSTH